MTEHNQRAEKQEANVGKEAGSAQTRESLSQEAMHEAMKTLQASSGTAAARDGAAAAIATGKDAALPGLVVNEQSGGKLMHDSLSKNAAGIVRDANGNSYAHEAANKFLNKADAISEAVKDGKLKSEEFGTLIKEILNPQEGVKKLSTGDFLVKEDDRQSLFTPNGDRITINSDGTNVIKGDVSKVSTDSKGKTTVEFGDGATVSFNKEGFLEVTRGDKSAYLGPVKVEKWPTFPNEPKIPFPEYPFPKEHYPEYPEHPVPKIPGPCFPNLPKLEPRKPGDPYRGIEFLNKQYDLKNPPQVDPHLLADH